VVVDAGKRPGRRRVRTSVVVHPSQIGGPLPAHELTAAAIAGWRRWGRALDDWARASRGAPETIDDRLPGSHGRLPRGRQLSPPTASVGTG
jgi:hypothetical protein